MGYCGLENWGCVDGAADLRSFLLGARGTNRFHSLIKEAIKEQGNDYNPSGCVNLALLLESGDLSAKDLGKRVLFTILDHITSLLEDCNDDYHDKSYLRLYNVVKNALRG